MAQRLVAVAAVLLVSACGSVPVSSNTPNPSSSPSSSFSPSSKTPPPTGTPAASPTPTASNAPSELLFAVTEGATPGGGQPNVVAIVDMNGYAKAKATFTPRLPVYIPGAAVPLQSSARVVGAAVYYIDGYGAVRALRTNQSPQLIATFPRQPAQYETWFAVKQDGSSVVVGQLQFPAIGPAPSPCQGMCLPPLIGPWIYTLQIAAPGGVPTVLSRLSYQTQPDMANSGWKPTFPVGWTADGPIAMVPTYIGTQNAWDGGRLYVLETSGDLGRQIGGSDCRSASIAPSGLIACMGGSDFAVTVRNSAGTALWATDHHAVNALVLFLSPDGQAVADNIGGFVETRSHGQVRMPDGFSLEGFLDNNTVIGRPAIGNGPDLGDLSWISLGDPTTVHDLGFKGDFVGTLG